MQLPFFYKEIIDDLSGSVTLDEETSKHIVQVLRMQNGEQIQLTDGKGKLCTCAITDNNRKKCTVSIKKKSEIAKNQTTITIAVSPLKNNSRFEWFLEKATEIGVNRIIPLLCTRTEKTTLKPERLKGILISAMLQSRQCWLPELTIPLSFSELAVKQFLQADNFIAHCVPEEGKNHLLNANVTSNNVNIFIGPEGDFSEAEIHMALAKGFMPVSLGSTRLRTETAALYAATILCAKAHQ